MSDAVRGQYKRFKEARGKLMATKEWNQIREIISKILLKKKFLLKLYHDLKKIKHPIKTNASRKTLLLSFELYIFTVCLPIFSV